MIKKIILFCSLFILFLCPSVLAATNVPMSNSTYSYSPVKNMGTYYYYDSYISNLSIGTWQETNSSQIFAGRSRTYAYFTSANALRSANQYTAKMRVCGAGVTFGSQVAEAVPTKIYWAYNTTNSMTGAIRGNLNDVIMTYQVVSPQNGCIDFSFIFTPPVDGLRAVGFWVTYSRLSPVSTCWEADCSSEHRQDTYLVDTRGDSPNSGEFRVSSFTMSYIEGGTSTAVLERNQQLIIQEQQQTNQNLQDIEDSMNDESSPDDELEDTLNDLSSSIPAYGPVSSIITMPISLYTAYFNQVDGTCHEYNLGSLLGTNLKLPCINLEQKFGSDLWGTIDALFSIFMVYNICMLIFSCYTAIINLDDDFRQLYTPQHAGLTRTGRGQMEGKY